MALHLVQFNTVELFKILILTLQIVFEKSLLHPCSLWMCCCYLIVNVFSLSCAEYRVCELANFFFYFSLL